MAGYGENDSLADEPASGGYGANDIAEADIAKPGFIPTVKRTGGQMLTTLATSVEDITGPNAATKAVKDTGQGIIDRNPAGIGGIGDIVQSPWLAIKEATGQFVPQIAAAATGAAAGGAAGRRIAGAPGAAIGAGIGALTPIFTQEYGGIRQDQQESGQESIPRALGAATAATALERVGLGKALKFIKSPGSVPISSIPREIGNGVLKEGATEAAQTSIEQVGAFKDPTAPENLQEAGFSGVMGGIGGGVVGGAMGAAGKMRPTPAAPAVAPAAAAPAPTVPAVPAVPTPGDAIRAAAPEVIGPLTGGLSALAESQAKAVDAAIPVGDATELPVMPGASRLAMRQQQARLAQQGSAPTDLASLVDQTMSAGGKGRPRAVSEIPAGDATELPIDAADPAPQLPDAPPEKQEPIPAGEATEIQAEPAAPTKEQPNADQPSSRNSPIVVAGASNRRAPTADAGRSPVGSLPTGTGGIQPATGKPVAGGGNPAPDRVGAKPDGALSLLQLRQAWNEAAARGDDAEATRINDLIVAAKKSPAAGVAAQPPKEAPDGNQARTQANAQAAPEGPAQSPDAQGLLTPAPRTLKERVAEQRAAQEEKDAANGVVRWTRMPAREGLTIGSLRAQFKTSEGMDGQVLVSPPGWRKGVKSYVVSLDRTGGKLDDKGRTKFYPTVDIGKYKTEEAARLAAEKVVADNRKAPDAPTINPPQTPPREAPTQRAGAAEAAETTAVPGTADTAGQDAGLTEGEFIRSANNAERMMGPARRNGIARNMGGVYLAKGSRGAGFYKEATAPKPSALDSEPSGGVLPPGFRGMTWRQAVDKIVAEHGRAAYIDGKSLMYPSGRQGQSNGIGNVPADVIQYATEALKPKPAESGGDWWDELDADPLAAEKLNLTRIKEISERQKMGLHTDHMRPDGLAATGWSAESAANAAKAMIPPVVRGMSEAAQKSVDALRGLVSDVRHGPVDGNLETITFKFDGKPHKGILKGRNVDLVVAGDGRESDRAVAVRVMLDGDATHNAVATAEKAPPQGRVPEAAAPVAEPAPTTIRERRERQARAQAATAEPAPAATDKESLTVAPAKNTVFTEDAAAAARARLKAKLGRLQSGLDPETIMDGITLAGYHIEKGARTFAAYARAMVEDLGDAVKPYLQSWYMAVRSDPRAVGFKADMDKASSIEDMTAADMDALLSDSGAASNSRPGILRDHLRAEIAANRMPKGNPALRKIVEAFDGAAPDQVRMKVAQEDLEAAIVQQAREIVASNKGEGDRTTFTILNRLYDSQPNLNIRTSTSIDNQAYSTPAPLAYLGARLADVTQQTTMYEPTGGNGMLAITAKPANVTATELDTQRVESLKAQGINVTQGDALKASVPAKSKDRVMTNPPFGPIKNDNGESIKVKFDGYTLGQIDHLIAARALETMKDDGKATLIIGANKASGQQSNNDLIFFNWLYGNYNVASHFEVEGDLYQRQGAGWPVRVITIHGRMKSKTTAPNPATIKRANTWSDVYERFQESLDAGRDSGRAVASPVGAGVRPNNDAKPLPGTVAPKAGRADPSRPEGRTASDGNVPRERAGAVVNRAAEPASRLGERSDAVGSNDQAPGPVENAGVVVSEAAANAAGSPRDAGVTSTDPDNQFQTRYVSRSDRKDEGVLIPVNMAGPTQDALNRLEDEVGNIDQFAAKELGYKSVAELHRAFMGLQVDSVASAISQIKAGKGIIIADQTGIGKGRQAAGIIRWAAKNGKTPIFVTVKPSLFTDMYGDLHDIGTDDIQPLLMNVGESIKGAGDERLFANQPLPHRRVLEGIASSGRLPAGRNALFMTYSQINVDNIQRRAVMALAPNAVFVLDESHNAGGASATGEFIKGALDLASGVTYLSATYAKRPDNMPVYFKTDIGDAVADDVTLMAAMAAGGLPLQTVVSNNLVKAGQMFRRERSYDGVSIESRADTEHKAEHVKLSDETTLALRAIVNADRTFHHAYVKALQKELEKEGSRVLDMAGNQAQQSVDHTQFSSVVHNFVRQMLLGLKAQEAANDAIRSLKRGEKPLIAVENTMGSFLAEYAENNNIKVGDSLGSFDYRTVLSRALERSRYIVRQMPNGDKVKEYIPMGGLDPLSFAAYTKAQAIIDGLKIDIPVSPIDWMRDQITKAGYTVAEVTGRNLSVDYSDTKRPKLSQIDQREQKDKVRTTRQFNDGTLDAIILNVAGSTGISLHASEKFKDQRQRHMIVAQAAQDINIFMQMLGRVHRTGQVRLPKYTLLSADLPAEIRPTALLSGKMKSLNANTSSNTESATSVKAADMLNKYGDQIVGQYLADNPELARDLDLGGAGETVIDMTRGGEESTSFDEDIARKATGRLALMPVKVQEQFYAEVEEQYQALIDYLNKTNQNDLEPRTFDFDAQETSSAVLFEGQNKASPFGEDALYGEYSVKAQGKAMSPEEIRAAMAEHLAGKTAGDHMKAMAEPLQAAFNTMRDGMAEDEQKAKADAVARAGASFLDAHKIGSMFRVDISGESYNAIVTNIRSTHKATGNPFSLSKIQVTIAVNGALRSVTLPATQFSKIEVSRITGGYGSSVESAFKEGPPNERETAKIVTGNLLGAYGEIEGTRGSIITFSKSDGTTEQGILLPKAFNFTKDVRQDYRLKTAGDVFKFLTSSTNENIDRFGINSRDSVVRVLPAGKNGITIQVPKSRAKGGKYFLDTALRDAAGDFVSSGNFMRATVTGETRSKKALDVLMKKGALYALPSMAEEARQIVGDTEAPPAAGAKFSRSRGRGVSMRDAEALKARIRAVLPNAPEMRLVESIDEVPPRLQDEIRKEGAEDDLEAVYYEGIVYGFPGHWESLERGEFVMGHHEIRHHGMRVLYMDKDGGLKALDSKLLELHRQNPALQKAAQAIKDSGRAGQKETVKAIEEALADMPAEQVAALTGWDKFVAAIRDMLRAFARRLRNAGLTSAAKAIEPTAWTDRDVAAFVLQSEKVSGRGAGGARFSRGTTGAMPANQTTNAKDGRLDAAIEQLKRDPNVFWHGSPSGDMRGGKYGLHLGTYEAAKQALEARIGAPAEGEWDGSREYGKTLLRPTETGYGVGGPKVPSFPTGKAVYSDGSLVSMTAKPSIVPYRLTGEMSNRRSSPHEDFKANGYMLGQIKRGTAKRGYFYTNVGEDSGSISIVVPSSSHLERIDPIEHATRTAGARLSRPTTLAERRAALEGEPARFSRAAAPAWVTSGSAALQGAAGKIDTYAPTKSIAEKAREMSVGWKQKLVQGMFDAYAPLKELSMDAYIAARMTKSADGAFEGMLMYGKPVMTADGGITGDLDGKGFLGTMKELNGEHDRFFMWLAGNRAERLLSEGKENLFTADEIAAMKALSAGTMQDGRDRTATYRKSLQDFNTYSKAVLDVAEKAGLIDPESRKLWEHDFYVPFYRMSQENEISGPTKIKGLVRQKAFERLKGGKENLGDLMDNTLRNWSHLLSASLANVAASKSLLAAEQAGIAIEAKEAQAKEIAKATGLKGNATYFMDQGEQRWFVVEDAAVLQAVSSMEAPALNGLPLQIMAKFKKYLTVGVTIAPAFKIRNLMRDTLAAPAANEMSYNIAKNLAEGWKATDSKTSGYAQILFGGGLMRFGTYLEGDRASHVKRLIDEGIDDKTILNTPQKVKAALGKAWDAWQDFGDRMENVNRTALYQQLLDKGMSPREAAYRARDMMDFSLQGSWAAMRTLTAVVPFLNARMQGLYRLGRAVKEDPKRMGYMVAAVSMASIALMLAYEDDEDWKAREDWDRDAWWWFKIGDTAYRIPKPFELGAMGTIAERSLELLINDEMTGKRFAERMKQMVMGTFAINPVPQMFKPMLDLYANKDSFTGRHIETLGMERLSKPERYGPNTSALAKTLGMAGEYTGLSPVQIDHMMRAYFGWLGTMGAETVDAAVNPFSDVEKPARKMDAYFGGFVKELPAASSRYLEDFYEQAKVTSEAMADLRRAREAHDFEKVAQIMEDRGDKIAQYGLYQRNQRQLAEVNKQIRMALADPEMDSQAKRAKLDDLNARRNRIALRVSLQSQAREAALQ